MRWKLARTLVLALCALFILGAGASVLGCSAPWAASSRAKAETDTVINQAIYRLQSVLGLADGAISQSSQPPMLANSDVSLKWVGGRADVDLATGHIRAILIDLPAAVSGQVADSRLDEEADRVVALLGWDPAALETHGFKEGGAATASYFEVGTVYEKTWIGHDPEGLLNDGILQVGLDVRNGGLHSFLYSPGPETALDLSKTISREVAIKTAKEGAAKAAFLSVSTTTTSTTAPPETTTTTAKSKSKATTTTTTAKPASTTTTAAAGSDSAVLMHTDKPGITGGKDMLVWVVTVAGDKEAGRLDAIVYVDAVGNKVLLVMAG